MTMSLGANIEIQRVVCSGDAEFLDFRGKGEPYAKDKTPVKTIREVLM
jgi:hypothetical protein